MSCDYYDIEGSQVHFSENWEGGCLCTFPHNYSDGVLYQETINKLAMLGAAVIILHRERQEQPEEQMLFIPDMLPKWMTDEIERIVPIWRRDDT